MDTTTMMHRAEELAAQGNYDESLALLEGLVRENPDDPMIRFNLGNLYARLERWDEAIAAWNQTHRILPRFNPVLLNLALASFNRGDFGASEMHLKSLLALDPKSVDALLVLGTIYFRDGNYLEARSLFERIVAINSRHTVALNNIGLTLHASGDADGARRYFGRAISTDPNYANAFYNIGLLDLEENDLAGAEQAFLAALRIEPANNDAMINLGMTYLNQRKPEQAIETLVKVVSTDPENAVANYNLGLAYLEIERFDKAAERFAVCFRNGMNEAPALLYNLGIALYRSGKLAEAKQHWSRMLEREADPVLADEARKLLEMIDQ